MRSYIIFLSLIFSLCMPAISKAQTPERPNDAPATVGNGEEVVKVKTIVARRVPKKTYTGKRARKKMDGYRIQIYTGSNDRASKEAAHAMKDKVQKIFPELSVYVTFQSPRWVCRIGDFVSRAEAKPYISKLRRARISTEARIVRSTVLRAY